MKNTHPIGRNKPMNKWNRFIARIVIVTLISSIFMNIGPTTQAAPVQTPAKPSHGAEILVKYKTESKGDGVKTKIKSKLKLTKLDVKQKMKHSRIEVLEVSETDDIKTIVAALKSDPDVAYAQPNYKLLSFSAAPADERFDEQWGLLNNGQSVAYQNGTTGIDISALSAWEITLGSTSTVIGVLDTGIDIRHLDLKSNIFKNLGEIAGNSIDDDGNGYIDDLNGWDFANDNNSVYDNKLEDKHGTHVAGIIAANADNQGIRGVAPGVKILPLKFIMGNSGYTSDALDAIEYAKQMGVKIINCSFGGTDYNYALKEEMETSGILFIGAAGNNGKDSSTHPIYPASFDLPNMISVAAVTNQGKLASFSNFGMSVDVAAPGVAIMSTLPEDEYAYQSGTSSAAPFVAGIAALIHSQFPDLTASQMAARIKNSSLPSQDLNLAVASQGMVNASTALAGTIDLKVKRPVINLRTRKTPTTRVGWLYP